MIGISMAAGLLLLCAAGLQWRIAISPDNNGDVVTYSYWGKAILEVGIVKAYFGDHLRRRLRIDYPPVIPGLLSGIAWIDKQLTLESLPTGLRQSVFLIRVSWIGFNLLLGLCLFVAVWRDAAPWTALGILSLWLFNPGVVLDTAYWGQGDVCGALAIFLAFYFFFSSRIAWSWIMTVIAILCKPLTWPFAPVILLLSLRDYPLGKLLRPLWAAVMTLALILFPFITENHLLSLIERMLFDVDANPYVSVNGHNLWWLLVDQRDGWVDASTYFLIPGLSYTLAGLLLFGSLYVYSVRQIWKEKDCYKTYYWLALIAYGFFLFSTHMHENHLFLFFPFFLVCLHRHSMFVVIALLASLAFFINIVAHDDFLRGRILGMIFTDHVIDYLAGLPSDSQDRLRYWLEALDPGRWNACINLAVFTGLFFLRPGNASVRLPIGLESEKPSNSKDLSRGHQ